MAILQQLSCGCRRLLLMIMAAGLASVIVMPVCGNAETGYVKAVVLSNWPPQYQTDGTGSAKGFAIDVLDHVAASADLKVQYKVVDTWEEMFDALRNGQADIIPNQGITAERKKWFAFTSPVETFQVVIFVRQTTSDIKHKLDLGGRVVATIQYNVGTRLMNSRHDVDHRIYSTLKEGFWELLAGQVDALIYPEPVLMKLAMETGMEGHIKVVGEPLVEIKRAMSVHKDNTALLHRLKPAVEDFVLSKEYERIYTKWYGRPKPFWTPKRILWMVAVLMLVVAAGHAGRVNRVNRRLRKSIEAREKAEAALVLSEKKYRLIVENQSDLTVKLDADGQMRYTSTSFCNALGVTKGDNDSRGFITLIRQEDRQEVKLAMQSLQVAPHACRFEGRILTIKGWRWYSWSCNALVENSGRIKEVIAIGRDTSERKKAELQVQHSEEKFRAMFEQAAEAVVLLNMETLSVSEFNAAAHQSLGYSRIEFERIGLGDLVVAGPMETTADVIDKVIQCREEPLDIGLRTKSGQIRYFLMKQRPLAVNGGKYFLGIWHDITDRKMLEEHLVQSQKMEAIGTLAGGVAHDFNNILSIIIGNTELAIQDIPGGHTVAGKLREIQTAGMRAKEVVRQLLSFSRRDEENRSLVQLVPLVEEGLKLLRATIPTTIDLQINIHAKELPIMADATQIHQILINLCNNAAQAMEYNGGTINLTVLSTDLDEKAAKPFRVKAGPYALIRVEDTGGGIPPENIERIFEPYFTTKQAHEGTGMGLAIVHGIATRHKGAIDVDSRPGKGTVFKVLLPVSDSALNVEAETDETISRGNERILLVDDEPSIAFLGREYLTKLGYHPKACSDSADAFDRFKANPSHFDLIITDMTMPKMTGTTLARKVLKIRPEIPIILCTGYHSKVDKKSVNAMGINTLLQKPYTLKALADAIRKALNEQVDSCI